MDVTPTLRTILVADSIRRAMARSKGLDESGLLPWSVLKESEQDQWLSCAETYVEVFDRLRKKEGLLR